MNGNCGSQSDGDCYVKVDLSHDQGIVIKISSPVLALFKNAILESIHEVCHLFSIEHANIFIDDFGCLDFVLRARLTTAIKRAQNRGVNL